MGRVPSVEILARYAHTWGRNRCCTLAWKTDVRL